MPATLDLSKKKEEMRRKTTGVADRESQRESKKKEKGTSCRLWTVKDE